MSIHNGISCDYCRKKNFSHHRYKCLICNDFDLCGNCYEKKTFRITSTHSNDHPMQLIITENDYEKIYFGTKRTKYSSGSFVCPLCNKNGFSLQFLIEHYEKQHRQNHSIILCPICFIQSNHLLEHLYQHIDENSSTKAKKLLPIINETFQENLLGKFFYPHTNRFNHHERYLFFHALLTNLLKQDIPMN